MVDVKVVSIEPGSIDDFAEVGDDFQSQLEGYTPYYINVELTKVDLDAESLENSSFYSDMEAEDANGDSVSSVSIIGDFAPCNTGNLEASVDDGTPQKFCYIVAAETGVEVTSAIYSPYEGDYSDDPIVWKK